ncbi:lamin tail domain-containing protein [candidate division WOR-3 bacterium]|nr:lamin tail domain-containing protein [candidate division WOR-3 bacterium]
MKTLFFIFSMLIAFTLTAQTPDVVINEFKLKGSEWVELYNTTSGAIDLTGWTLRSVIDGDTFSIASGTNIAGNSHLLLDFGSTYYMDNDGDSFFLLNNSSNIVDYIAFGNLGPVPVFEQTWTISRITDGLFTNPNDANDFNVDGTPTPDSANDAHPAPLNGVVCLNEIDPYPAGGSSNPDSLELYNPNDSIVNLEGWMISDGDDFAVLTSSHVIPAHGYLVIDENEFTSFDFASQDVFYLFTPDTQRVEQMGWYGTYNDTTYQRVPDGAGPHDGYDWVSSGGEVTLFDKQETWGATNGTVYVEEEIPSVNMPAEYALFCPYLSRSGSVEISFMAPGNFTLGIYSLDGRLVKELFSGRTDNRTSMTWDLSDSEGRPVAQGRYMLMLSDEMHHLSVKLQVLY